MGTAAGARSPATAPGERPGLLASAIATHAILGILAIHIRVSKCGPSTRAGPGIRTTTSYARHTPCTLARRRMRQNRGG